jgi:hypothetical protein
VNRVLVALHGALVLTVFLPVFKPNYSDTPWLKLPWRDYSRETWSDYVPAEEASKILDGNRSFLRSVVAAGLPAFLALLNLPLLALLRGESARRWRALSSMSLGLLSTSVISQLLARYGYGREWGGWVILAVSLMLWAAGTAAVAGLRPGSPFPAVIRDA